MAHGDSLANYLIALGLVLIFSAFVARAVTSIIMLSFHALQKTGIL